MKNISNFQIYCMLLLMTIPISFLITPASLILTAMNAAWLTQLTAIVPGALLMGLYIYLINKSQHPFPVMLEDCLGKIAGKITGLLYIVVSLFSVSLTLSLFVYFIESNVLPGTPFSVFMGAMLLASLYAIKTGLENIARVSELMVFIGLPFSIIILFLGLTAHPDPGNLLPLANVSYDKFALAVLQGFYILSNSVVVLVLAFFCNRKRDVPRTLFMVLGTYIAVITFTCVVTLLLFPTPYLNLQAYPTFKVARAITLGEFIQNMDILFVAIWITSIFGAITVKWFFSCYIIQQVFNLKDYRFLASPTALIIGIAALMIGPNILELEKFFINFVPLVFSLFFIIIPVIMAIILACKPASGVETSDSPVETG